MKQARSRTDNVIKSGAWSSVAYLLNVIMGMYCQRVFILEMGYDLYGLNAMFTTIVSTLAVSELGIGTAIVFSLYRPLAVHDEKKIGALVSLYRNVYIMVGGIVAIGSCIMIPVIPSLTGFKVEQFIGAYLLFVLNVCLTYFFTFNQTILNADQKTYIVSIITCGSKTLYNILQIIVLYATHDFMLYTATNLICTLGGNIALNGYVKKHYPYIRKYKNESITVQEKKLIKSKVFALIYHKIGGYLVNGGDNFILSGFLGVATVGYYSNYTFITNTLKSLIASVFAGFMSGFGNLNATEDSSRSEVVFKRARMVYFTLYAVTSAGLYCSAESFLRFLYTDQTVLPHYVLLLIVLNYFIYGYSACYGDYRAAAGVFEPDRYLSLIVPILNVIVSILLVKPLGIAGVLLGTFICYAVKECTAVPIICCKYIFKCKTSKHLTRLWIDVAVMLGICILSDKICGLLVIDNLILQFLVRGFLSVVIASICLLIVYGRTEEFKFVKGVIIEKFLQRGRNK